MVMSCDTPLTFAMVAAEAEVGIGHVLLNARYTGIKQLEYDECCIDFIFCVGHRLFSRASVVVLCLRT
jgi:hypothetical protein